MTLCHFAESDGALSALLQAGKTPIRLCRQVSLASSWSSTAADVWNFRTLEDAFFAGWHFHPTANMRSDGLLCTVAETQSEQTT